MALARACGMEHIMEFASQRALESLFAMLDQGVRNIHRHSAGSDFAVDPDHLRTYMEKYLIYAIMWCFTGDAKTPQYVDCCALHA